VSPAFHTVTISGGFLSLKFSLWHLCNREIVHMYSEIHKKGKVIPLHAMEAHRGRGGIAPAHT
jgi:hypothetical protein